MSFSGQPVETQFTLFEALRYNQNKPKAAQYVPMLAYTACTLEADAEAISHALGNDFSPNVFGHNPITIAWNAVDAGCNIKIAWDLFNDDEHYYPCKSVMIGLNLASGLNLLSLTDSFHTGPYFGLAKLGAGNTLASPAFAFAMFCDFVVAAIDCYYSSEKGYLERMIGEVEFYEKKLRKLPKPPVDSREDLLDFECNQIDRKNFEKYFDLVTKQKELLLKIEGQLNYYQQQDKAKGNTEHQSYIEKQTKKIDKIFPNKDSHPRFSAYRKTYSRGYVQSNCEDIYKSITDERKNLHYANQCKLVTKFASFSGMLLQSLPTILLLAGSTMAIPYLNIISLCIISTVALIYLYQLLAMADPAPQPTGQRRLSFVP